MKEKTIGCIHFPACSGCVYDSCVNPPEKYLEAKNYFEKNWGIELSLVQGEVRHWRSRAKLAVRAPDRIGLFEKGTHQVLPIPHCQVHHPQINRAVERFLEAFRKAPLSCYDEKTHKGDLRYLQCIVERKSQKVSLSLVLNRSQANEAWHSLVNDLYDPLFWHSIWFNFNDRPTNTIFTSQWQRVAGQEEIWETIAGIDVAFGPSHFGQANLEMYEQLIFEIQNSIRPHEKVVELYAGIGVIGLTLAQKGAQVLLCELECHAQRYFEMAKARLPTAIQERLTYQVDKAERCLNHLHGATSCVVDPPRKGLGKELLHTILEAPALNQLIYISCEWESLERDLKTLGPNWKVTKAKSFLFFPGTNQIETVAFIEKMST